MSTLKVDAIRHNSATSDAITTAADGTCTAKLTSVGGGGLSHRNIIINGAMNVSQRGTSFTTVASGTYTLDRMRYHENIDSGVVTITQESVTDLPSFTKAIKINCTTAETGVPAKAGSKFVALSHFLEGQDLQQLAYGTSSAKQITLSFYVKSNITGTFCVSIYKPDQTARNVSLGYTINSANTWERKTLTFPADTGGGGIDNDNGSGLQFYFVLARQQGYQGTASTTWGNNTDARFANLCTATIFENTNDHIMFTGLQLEVGDTATTFEHRSYGDELQRCRRYYQVLVDQAGGSSQKSFAIACAYSSGSMHSTHLLSPQMRAVPTLDYTTGTDYYRAFSNGSADPFNDFTLVGNSHPHAVDLAVFSNLSVTSGSAVLVRTYNSAARVAFTAEL